MVFISHRTCCNKNSGPTFSKKGEDSIYRSVSEWNEHA
ncbi:rCG58544 [Rattus norvegicus]|uniref:RCG58544 n=1 Tax=Rattus norvegicus TaxID=10116 RepID=A6K706_RAT|nr:rCG58544 [Rattus norvegicus]